MKLPSAPFSFGAFVFVVLPTLFEGLAEGDKNLLQNIRPIFQENRSALERELGATLILVEEDPGYGARWFIGPVKHNPALAQTGFTGNDQPVLFLDREQQLLIADASTPTGIWETFSLLRSLARFPGGTLKAADCASKDEAVQRIVDEVGDSYPAFQLRGLKR
jgi:hypothetical protein